MGSSPEFSIASVEPSEQRTRRRVDARLRDAIIRLVADRNHAIRNGERDVIDATYDGLDYRDWSLQRDDHERTSYYDWYMNRIERGMGADVKSIRVVPIYDLGSLPFRYNANWSIYQPEFEVQVKTEQNSVSWYVRQDMLKRGELRVILPNFSDAPWKAPVLETRGDGSVEFNAETFAKELAERIGLQCCTWSVYLEGLVRVRAFALNVDPSEGLIEACLLTDKENFSESDYGKWCLADWRFYDFFNRHGIEELCEQIRSYAGDKPDDYKHPKFDYWVQPKEDFEVILACAMAIREPEFMRFLKRFELSDDFETAVFHSHDERCECNFALPENQDLSVLTKSG